MITLTGNDNAHFKLTNWTCTGSTINKLFRKIWQNSQKNIFYGVLLVKLQACAYNGTKERFYRWCLTVNLRKNIQNSYYIVWKLL